MMPSPVNAFRAPVGDELQVAVAEVQALLRKRDQVIAAIGDVEVEIGKQKEQLDVALLRLQKEEADGVLSDGVESTKTPARRAVNQAKEVLETLDARLKGLLDKRDETEASLLRSHDAFRWACERFNVGAIEHFRNTQYLPAVRAFAAVQRQAHALLTALGEDTRVLKESRIFDFQKLEFITSFERDDPMRPGPAWQDDPVAVAVYEQCSPVHKLLRTVQSLAVQIEAKGAARGPAR